MKNVVVRTGLLLCSVFAAAVVFLWLWPVNTSVVRSQIRPASDYQESVAWISEALNHDMHPDVMDYCRSMFLGHGRKTERAVVMYHGYTNCPRQYEILAKMFFDQGYNVYVPRMPYHGLKDRLNPDIQQLTLNDLLEFSDRSVDIVQGLGDEITVLGLSLGGVLAARAAQFRSDVDTAVILVPSFGWYYLPGVVKPLLNLAYFMPDMLMWWHPRQRENRPIPYSMYHKFSSRGMGHALMISLAVLRESRQSAPLADHIIFMTTDLDRAVDFRNVEVLTANWVRHGKKIQQYRFPAELGIEHDIIDPLQAYQKTDVVYQKIFDMINAQ